MRSDISKVVVERPRTSGGWDGCKPKDHWREDLEHAPKSEKIRRKWMKGYRAKQFSDFLSPLEGFFTKNVGRNWDEVYRELRANLSPSRTMDMHIMQHVRGMVELDVERIDGVIYPKAASYGGHISPLENRGKGNWFYVDPDTKILSLVPKHQKKVQPRQISVIYFPDNQWLQYRLIANYKWVRGQRVVNSYNWYALFLAKKPEPVERMIPEYESVVVDGVRKEILKGYNKVLKWEFSDVYIRTVPLEHDSWRTYRPRVVNESAVESARLYGNPDLYCYQMKQLNTKELNVVRQTLARFNAL
jgi:hypothetical protein